MNTSAAALEHQSPLVTLLDREFAADSLGDLAGGGGAAVPWRLWSDALYAPLREFLQRPGKELRAELVTACFHLGGRKEAPPPELPVIVELLHAGSLIVDDIEDGSLERRGAPALHRIHGVPTALNAGNWLYFFPFEILEQLDLPPHVRLRAYRLMTKTLHECHYGQALDLNARLTDLEQSEVAAVVHTTAQLKTGSLMGLAAALGALAGGAEPTVVDAALRFGRELGVALQMLDDLSGLLSDRRRDKGEEDLKLGRPTWPWSLLSTMLDADAYFDLRERARGVQQREPAHSLLVDLRRRLGGHAQKRVHAHLEQAFGRLAEATPNGMQLGALRREIERLERSYV